MHALKEWGGGGENIINKKSDLIPIKEEYWPLKKRPLVCTSKHLKDHGTKGIVRSKIFTYVFIL